MADAYLWTFVIDRYEEFAHDEARMAEVAKLYVSNQTPYRPTGAPATFVRAEPNPDGSTSVIFSVPVLST